MNEEIDESEFYHQDFTTASEWEVFIARLEEIINQWKSDDIKSNNKEDTIWKIRTETLTFVDFDFNLSYHQKQLVDNSNNCETNLRDTDEQLKPLFDLSHDFELYDSSTITDHSNIAKWYGLSEFIVLYPVGKIGITTESKIKMLLSSIYIVSGNLDYDVPIFIQIREKWQQCYLGVYQKETIRSNLEMVHLKYGPRLCLYLSGLLELFKSKIVSSTMDTTISVSLQASYLLQNFGNFIWKQDYVNPDSETFDIGDLCALPFGVTVDPIESLILKTSWSGLNHRACRDSEAGSSFDPLEAQKWSILMKPSEQPVCLLGECLVEFTHLLSTSSGNIYEILGDFAAAPPPVDNNPLDLLTEPKVPTIGTLLTRAARSSLSRNRRSTAAPLPEDVLVPMLYFLFPDASDDSDNPYKSNEKEDRLHNECRGFKTCNVDSLVWRLTVVLAHSLQSLGGIRAFAHLWYEFVQEMRYRWEKCISIPGLLPGSPDLRTNLLHQKMQMLNCCIDRKHTRENTTKPQFESAENTSEEEDEFFDCAEKPAIKHSLWNQPVGRLGCFEDLKLLKTGDLMYIPLTQEPVPKSEDQLEEDTDVLLKLGSDAQGSELRAKMMSASLLSDMESFKAANPGSILEDFIRWYSPRDWIEEDSDELDEWGQKKGTLSGRMLIENNFWLQTWQSAQPVPANRQKRLFDDTKEAEKVLHYLDSRTPSQIVELLSPVLAHTALYRLYEELSQIELPDDRWRCLIKSVERISREPKLIARRFEAFIQEVTALELRISEINSLSYKFNPAGGLNHEISQIIVELVTGKEVEIEKKSESDLGGRLVSMFYDLGKSKGEEEIKNQFPLPVKREIVMRVVVPRPQSYSAKCPQMMRAVLGKNEFRLCGIFSEDVVFF